MRALTLIGLKIFILALVLVQNNSFAQSTRTEQPFDNRDVQALWPVSCLKQTGLERYWGARERKLDYKTLLGIDAVWGGIRKVSIINFREVVIKGEVGGYVCELFSESPKEYMWRAETLRGLDAITVYINSRYGTGNQRFNKYFKIEYKDDYTFELKINVNDFFNAADAESVRRGEVLENKIFYLMFKLNINDDNNAPVYYRYSYNVLAPINETSKIILAPRG